MCLNPLKAILIALSAILNNYTSPKSTKSFLTVVGCNRLSGLCSYLNSKYHFVLIINGILQWNLSVHIFSSTISFLLRILQWYITNSQIFYQDMYMCFKDFWNYDSYTFIYNYRPFNYLVWIVAKNIGKFNYFWSKTLLYACRCGLSFKHSS